jgi:FMN-dependent NADH-azoreductase
MEGDTVQLLHVDSSILGDGSVSRAVTADVVAALKHDIPASMSSSATS